MSTPVWDGTGYVPGMGSVLPPAPGNSLTITEPTDGAVVDPLVIIRGTGAESGASVDLYVDSNDNGNTAVDTVTAGSDGGFEFTGSTPLEVSPEGIVVGVGEDRSAKVTVTLEAASAADAQAAESEPAADEGYNPADHTVTEVRAYLDEHPDQSEYVLNREAAGKDRTTLTGGA
jgi:hypothetical protein